jgi:hypothetical protein
MQSSRDKIGAAHDISDAILAHISNFALGLVVREIGKGSRVLGSGTLASIEGRRGILTCGHVAEAYEKLPEIGLIRFTAGDPQRRILNLGDTQTIIVQSSDTFSEKKEVLDLAFTVLPPDIASSIAAQAVFLNIEKNRTKMEAWASTKEKHIDAVLGLVEEFSNPPFKEGREFISPMRGVLHSGHASAQENGLLTMKAMDYNRREMPESFGGMSGGGLWRAYFAEGENETKIVGTMLCGVVSWQIDETHLACQGWDRIDQGLVPALRGNIRI